MKKAFLSKGRRSVAFVLMLLMLLTSIVLMPTTASAAGPTSGEHMPEYRVIAYVTSWNWPGTYDPMTDEATTTVDPNRITHINYAFGHIVNAQGTGTYANGQQNAEQFPGTVDVPDPGKLKALVELKKINKDLKVLLSVGGWGMDGFCPIVHSSAKRTVFIESCIEICKRFGLDGIDMDYEYPGTSADQYDRLSCSHSDSSTGATSEPPGNGFDAAAGRVDGNDYLTLMKEFRDHPNFGWDYLLTIASGVGYDWNVCVPIAQYPEYLDFINIMCYDIYGEWKNHSEFNANLYGSGSESSDTDEGGGKVLSYDLVVNRLKLRGYPADLINVGIPIYGRERYYKRTTATTSTVTTIPAGLGDASWMSNFDMVMDLYNANSSTSSDVLKNVLSFEDIATDAPNKTTVAIGKGGVVTPIGGYTKEEAAEVELEFVSNTVKRVWYSTPNASRAEGVLTVKVKSSPKSADVGKTIARTYSATYDDIEDVVAKTDWIQDSGFGGGMYWEYSQDTKSGSPITAAIWNGLNGSRTTTTQPARGSGSTSKILNTGRKVEPPVISYRYDKSKNATTAKYAEWNSRENMQEGLTAVNDTSIGVNTGYGKVRFFQGKLYVTVKTDFHAGYWGVLPTLAPAYATSSNNMYQWMYNKNSGYKGAYGGGAEWQVCGNAAGYQETFIERNEYNKPLRAPDNNALQINSASPNKKQVHIGETIAFDINVTGGSGTYKTITNQVWFNGVKYDNVDGYLKMEKRKTGGPYPITSQFSSGTNKQKTVAQGGTLVYGTSGETKVALDNEGEKRALITPSPANAQGTVTFTATTPGVYYIFTQATDSTNERCTAQFSQQVEVVPTGTDIIDLSADVTHDAGASVNVGTKITATGSATGEDAVGVTYKFEFLKGSEVVYTRDFNSSDTAEFTPVTGQEGLYKVRVTVKNENEVTAIKDSSAFYVVQPLTITSVTPSTLTVGTQGTFKVTAIGGTGGYTYSLYIIKGGKIYYSKTYAAQDSFTYTPLEAGTYQVRAYCQDSFGTKVVKDITLTVS